MLETNITNTFASFQKYTAKESALALLSLLNKLEKLDWFDLNTEMAWKGLLEFRNIGWTAETVDNFDLVQTKVVSLLFPEDLKSLELALDNWSAFLVNQYKVDKKSKIAGDIQIVSAEVLLSELKRAGIKSILAEDWAKQYQNLSDEYKNLWFETWQHLDEKIKIIKDRLSLTFSFLRCGSVVKMYSVEEVGKILNGDGLNVDEYRLARTLGGYMLDGDGIDMARVVLDNLADPDIFEKKEYTWEDSFFMVVFLQFVFNFWSNIDLIKQNFVLSHYFVRSILAGIPMQVKLQHELYYENPTLANYVAFDFSLFKALEENVEEVVLSDNNFVTLGQLFKNFLGRFQNKFLDSYGRENFIDEILQNSNDKAVMKKSLREAFYIFVHLKAVDLLDVNINDEPTEKEYFENQLEHLLVLLLDEDYWDVLLDFYTKEDVEGKRVVKIGRLLKEIKENNELEKTPDLTEKMIKFNNRLKEVGLLKGDDDVIFFDEANNKFDWNEQILKTL